MKRDLTPPADSSLTVEPAQLPSSDQQLEQRVRLFLSGSNIPALRRLKVSVEGDTVMLAGQVNTYHEKQLAAEFTRRVAGVIHVIDLVEVRSYSPQSPMPRFGHWRPAASSVA